MSPWLIIRTVGLFFRLVVGIGQSQSNYVQHRPLGLEILNLKLGKEEAVVETAVERATTVSPLSSHRARPSSTEELKYANLVENWVPPTFPSWSEMDIDDQEWIFQRKDHNIAAREVENGGLAFTHGSSQCPWPRVCFLPEANIYALPYTVPY